MAARPLKRIDGQDEDDDEDSEDSSTDDGGSSVDESPSHGRFLCCMGLVSMLVTLSIASIVFAPFLGKALAENLVKRMSLSVEALDVGTINGSSTLSPRIRGRVGTWSLFPVRLLPARGKLRAFRAGEEMDVGVVTVPEVRLKPFSNLALDVTVGLTVTDKVAFGHAGRSFINSASTRWNILASVAVECSVLGFLPFRMSGIHLDKSLDLQGLHGFSQDSFPVKMVNLSAASGEQDALELTVVVALENPSYLTARILPLMTFRVEQYGIYLGTAEVKDLRLVPGTNHLPVTCTFRRTPKNARAIEAVIEGYMRRELQPITVLGSEESVQDDFLRDVLRDLRTAFNFLPPPLDFLRGVSAEVDAMITASARVYNPLPQALEIGSMALDVREGNLAGDSIMNLGSNLKGTMLDARQSSEVSFTLSALQAHITDTALMGRLFERAKKGSMVVGIQGPITLTIQPSFTVTVNYTAEHIDAELACPVLCR